ncbi:hypothetical protein CP02DC14_0557B, partial [Chlamydia psittaci 02DC14]
TTGKMLLQRYFVVH